MKINFLLISSLALFAIAGLAQTPIPLNTVPSRIVGHPLPETLTVTTANPNLVEGREFYSPQGVALDTSVSPPILYVSDPGNNRVLAWKNGLTWANNPKADLVIGQQDAYHTSAQGPGGTFPTGLNGPNGIVTDSNGNLWVVDTLNNRILRFPTPFQQSAQNGSVFPDMWVGQASLGSSAANFGNSAVNDQGLNLASSQFPVNIALDAQNNLWVVDAGNRRVLEFTAANLTQAQASGFSGLHASLEIGQQDFISNNQAGPTGATFNVPNAVGTPVAVAFDASGNLFVSDFTANLGGRVLVFQPPFTNKQSAARIMGIPYSTAPVAQVALGLPAGLFFIPSNQMMGVVDTGDSRIVLFDSFDSGKWPINVTNSPVATAVLGQTNYTNVVGNGGTSSYVPAPTASTFYRPTVAVYSAGQLFVADTLNNRVLEMPFTAGAFSAASQVLGQLNFTMSAPNMIEGREFDFYPNTSGSAADAGVAIDTSSTATAPHLYVSDPNNHRVLGFKDFRSLAAGAKADIVIGQVDFNSSLCNMTGNPATPTASSLCYPTGLAVDPKGNLYVADSVNSRVLRFPAPFAYQGTGPEPADLVLGQHQVAFSIAAPTSSTMKSPYGLALSDTNGLFVSDLAYNRVLFFPFDAGSDTFATGDTGMQASKVFGQQDFSSIASGAAGNQFSSPHHISVDNEARLYVVDSGNNRVMIFDQINGTLTPSTGAQALFQLTGFSTPRAVFVNPLTSEIWVGDNAGLVKKFPIYQNLQVSAASTANVQAPSATLALTQDQYGDLIVADATNRVGFYFPAADAINGGNFLPNCVDGPASTCRALSPGLLASLCSQGSTCTPGSTLSLFGSGTNAVSGAQSSFPLPTILGDTRVDMTWTNADGSTTTDSTPLYYTSPTQINFVVPMSAPATGLANLTVVQNSTGRIYAAGQVVMAAVSPAILMLEYTGNLRQAAVVNLADGTVNSTTNAAARGTSVIIYATGQGFVPGAPADGAWNSGAVTAPAAVRVNINGIYLDQMSYDSTSDPIPPSQWLEYSGLSSYPGLWQINVYIPHAVVPNKQIPLFITADGEANTVPGTFLTYINVK